MTASLDGAGAGSEKFCFGAGIVPGLSSLLGFFEQPCKVKTSKRSVAIVFIGVPSALGKQPTTRIV